MHTADRWRRETARRENGGHFTPKQFRELCGYYGYVCLCCGVGGKLTADHIIPISRGGSDSIDNVQPLCAQCNRKKGTKIINYRKMAVARVVQLSFF